MQIPTHSKLIYLHNLNSKDPPLHECNSAQAGQADVLLTLEPHSLFSNHF